MTTDVPAVAPSPGTTGTVRPADGAIGADEVDAFVRDGFLVVDRPLIDESHIDEARRLIDALLTRIDKAPKFLVTDMRKAQTVDIGRSTVSPNVSFCSDLTRGLRRTKVFATCRRVAEQLLGGPVQYEFDQAILKPPHTDVRTAWHTDLAYKRHPDSCPESVNFWVAMQDTDVDMGAMRFIPGSHQEEIEHDRLSGPQGSVLEAVGVDQSRAVPAPLPKGGFTVHGLRTLHGSNGNTTDRPRLGWVIHFVREDRSRLRRWAEERYQVDSYLRLAAARMLPVLGPVMVRVERILVKRGIRI